MQMADCEAADLLFELNALSMKAGAAILRHYAGGQVAVTVKTDGSPVTATDHEAEAIILDGLARLAPTVPIVSEERASHDDIPDISGGRFWLVDPLDGTREFLGRNDEFTVNIGMVEGGAPTMGVVHAPALAVTYIGRPGDGSWRIERGGTAAPIAARAAPAAGLTVVASRSHGNRQDLDAYLRDRTVVGHRQIGSSLKFCLLAAGDADLYPRFGPTMEWDTAAGDAVLRAAGGSAETTDGGPMHYGKPGFTNPPFVAFGRR